MRNIILSLIILVSNIAEAQRFCKDGDIILTKTNGIFFNQIGVIFIENDTPYVYFSDVVVFKMTLREYLKSDRHSIRRLDASEFISDETLDKMHIFAKAKENDVYDGAKFVWDIYRQMTGIPLCRQSKISVRSISKCYFLQ